MTNKPCVTILDHDDDNIHLEINGLDYTLDVPKEDIVLRFPYLNSTCEIYKPSDDLTKFNFEGFTIYHQKGGDCYVE